MHFKNIYPNITLSGGSLKTENVIITVIGPVTWHSYNHTAPLNASPTDYTSGSFSKKPVHSVMSPTFFREPVRCCYGHTISFSYFFFTLVRFLYQPISLLEFFICYVVLVGDAKKSSEASHFHIIWTYFEIRTFCKNALINYYCLTITIFLE